MGSFLVLIPSPQERISAPKVFSKAIEKASQAKSVSLINGIQEPWACAAAFTRRNGSGSAIASDGQSGSWLLAIGPWFHGDGYASGSEPRLLHAYLQTGALDLARALEGFFCIAIGDGRTQEVLVITDIIGSCHCFVRLLGAGIAVSSSSSVLAGLSDFHLDPLACQEYLCTGTVYEDRTIYQEVRKLAAASVCGFSDGKLRRADKYWDITNTADRPLKSSAAPSHLWETLIRATTRIGKTFPNPVCDLTGGYDSRALVAAFLGSGVPFSTTVSGDPESADVRISKALAALAHLPHVHSVLDSPAGVDDLKAALQLTDGEYDALEYARIMRIHQGLAARFDISLNGSFAEIGRGYWWDLLWPHAGKRIAIDSHAVARQRFAPSGSCFAWFAAEKRVDLLSHFAGVVQRTNAGLERLANTLQIDNVYLTMRMQRWQGRIASSTNQLWPCLAPFMFRSVLEAMLRAPPQCRHRSLLIRTMLALFRPQLAAYPLEHGYPAVPVTMNNMHRFWPLLPHYGAKIWSRVRARLPLIRSAPSSPQPLTKFLESRKMLLDPERMHSIDLFDPLILRERLNPGHPLYARILSLELALEHLVQAGSNPNAG
ncbi:MAG: hypothetical protein ACREX9_07690 [Gammaproteobacteria bacterium]